VTCPGCLSENTEETGQGDQFYCKDCQSLFNRPM
jgi:transposase-like protein